LTLGAAEHRIARVSGHVREARATVTVNLEQERDTSVVTEVRLYTINRGMMDSWVSVFKEKIMPTSAQYGVRIHAAFVHRPQNEFVWIRSYDSAETLEKYNTSPERAAYSQLTGPHVAKIEVREVETVVGELVAAN
jgi:quinol monooxygenase YgiN